MQLFPYQVEGAKFLASVGRGLLADEMGLGKSAQAIAASQLVGVNFAATVACVRRVAVVCPASLRENWRREFKRFWTSDDTLDLQVESYDKATRGALADWSGDVLILDEAHYLKSHKARRTQAVFGPKCDGVGGLVSRAANVFCLTGTPTPNNPSELWPMLRAVMPGAVQRESGKPMPYWPFVERFCYTRDTGFGITIVKGKNLPELKARIAPFMLRRKKDDVLKDLPPIRFGTLALEGKDWGDPALLPELKLIEDALAAGGVKALAALAPHVAQLRRVTGLAKVPAAIEWIRDFLDGSDRKLVLFAHHRDVIDAIHQAFSAEAVVVRGETGGDARQSAVDQFQRNMTKRLFIGQIQAAGVGLTLTAASDVLFVESSWVPAENEQAAARIHRVGQNNACVVRFAMLAGSIDEQIQKAVLRKTTDIERLWA